MMTKKLFREVKAGCRRLCFAWLIFSLIFSFWPGLRPLEAQASGLALGVGQDSSAVSLNAKVSAPSRAWTDFNVIKLVNNNPSLITVNSIKITRSGGSDDYFSKVALFLKQGSSRSQIGSDQALSSGAATFSGLALAVPASSESVVYAAGFLSSAAAKNNSVALGIVNAADVVAADSNTVYGSVAYKNRTISDELVIVQEGASTLTSSVIAPSATLSDFNLFRLENNTESDITVNSVKVTRSGGSDDFFNKIALYLVSSGGSRSQLGGDQILVNGTTYFSTSLNIKPNSSVKLAIAAMLSNSPANGSLVGLGVNSAEDVAPLGAWTISGTVPAVSRTITKTGPDIQAPAAPSNVKVESVGTTPTLRVSWDDPAGSDLAKINIYRSVFKDQLGAVVFTANRGVGYTVVKSFNDTNIIASTTYYYTLKAVDITGNESNGSQAVSGIVYAKGLHIFLDSSTPAAANINASSSDTTLAVFKLVASNTDAEVTDLKISGAADAAGSTNLDQLSALKLYVDGAFIASTTGPIFSFYAGGSKLSLTLNSSQLISLKGDLPPTAQNGKTISVKVAQLTAGQASGVPLNVFGLGTAANKMTIVGQSPSPTPAPTSTPTPTPSPTLTPSPTSTPTSCFPNNTLVKLPDDSKVYVIINCQKKWIQTAEEFKEGGYKWTDVKEVESPVIQAYADYLQAGANLLRAIGQERVYKVVNGKLLWVPTISAFNAQGLKWSEVQNVDALQLNQYQRAKLLQVSGDSRVYYITESGLKKHIINEQVFNSYSNKWEDIVKVSAAELNAYPDVVLIKRENDYRVYKLENGTKRWIKTPDAFNKLKLDWSKIAPVNSTEINAYPAGAAIE